MLAAVVAALGLMVSLWAWALSSPVGSAPDDTYHLPLAWCAWGEHETCVRGPDGVALVPETIAGICTYQRPAVSASCEYLRGSDLTAAGHLQYVGTEAAFGNTTMFHRFMRVFVGPDAERSAIAMRMFNGVLAGALFLWSLLIAPGNVRRAVALSWLVVLVPVGLFIIASTNPSSWATLGVASFWGFGLTFLAGSGVSKRRRVSAAIGAAVSLVIAVSARADTLVFIAGTVIALVVMRWPRVRSQAYARYAGIPIAVVLVVLFASTSIRDRLAAAWSGLISAEPPPPDPSLTVNGLNPTVTHLIELPSYLMGFIGGHAPTFAFPNSYSRGLGWLDTGVPSLVAPLVFAALVLAVGWGLQVYNWRKVVAVTIAGLTLVGSIIIPLIGANFGPTVTLQPRYSLPMVFVLVGLMLIRPSRLGSPRALTVALIIVGVFIAHAAASLANLRRYTNGETLPWTRLDLIPNWWWPDFPLSPETMWFFGLAAFAAFSVGVAKISRGFPRNKLQQMGA